MVKISVVIYNIVIATCRMNSLSVLDFLKSLFRKKVGGNIDYTQLRPQIIELPQQDTQS